MNVEGEDLETLTMLRPYWLDATALVKLVYKEPGSDHVQRIVRGSSWFETTWLCVAEAHGVLKRLFVKKKITSYNYHQKLYLLRSWIKEGRIKVRMAWLLRDEPIPIGSHDARRLAEKHGLDFSDAIQLFEFGRGLLSKTAGVSQAILVSSDKGLLRAATAEGFKVWNPEQDPDPPM